jgi:hypothetical protein
MIRAKPETIPFKIGDIVALTQELGFLYEVKDVFKQAFGILLVLEGQDGKEVWDWSTYYVKVGEKDG